MHHVDRPNPLPQLIPARLRHAVKRLDAMRWVEQSALPVEAQPAPVPLGREGDLNGLADDWHPVEAGYTFGSPVDRWERLWFRLEVPPASRSGDRHSRHLIWSCHGESTLHHQGTAIAGLDCAHPSCPLPPDGGTFYMETCLWQTAIWANPRPFTSTGLRFEQACLALRDDRLHKLWVELRVLEEWMETLLPQTQDASEWEGGRNHWEQPLYTVPPALRLFLDAISKALDHLDQGELETFAGRLEQLLTRFSSDDLQGRVCTIGHSHLDLVWRWPEAATRRKAVHSVSNMVDLLDRFPEFTCMLTQPWLLARLQQDDPQLWQRVLAHQQTGRMELEGVMEVESDVLLSCGETLVRSLVHGQRSFRKLAGRPAEILWLPDVFGYAGCLPQLMQLAGVRSFFTSKLSWNKITRFPYTSFVWEGADGTAVVAHIPPISFNGNAEVAVLKGAAEDHRQLGVHPTVLSPIGFGDGGGGPTGDQVERIRCLGDLATVPKTHWGSARAFFHDLHERSPRLPHFRGELYLERHRGTCTSQSEHKRLFRAAERALQAYEAACAQRKVPADPEKWERVIFGSFHDAIPGSSIGAVYEELNPQLEALSSDLHRRTCQLLEGEAPAGYFNPCAYPLHRVLRDGSGDWVEVDLPALASAEARSSPADAPASVLWQDRQLRNSLTSVRFDAAGALCELRFGGKTVALAGPPRFWIHPDHPPQHDAWEVELHDLGNGRAVEFGPLEQTLDHPLRIELTQDLIDQGRKFGRVIWALSKDTPALEIRVDVDWHTAHQWLRFEVPTGYLGLHARFGGPFGAALRPQAPGGEEATAKWEGSGSRWAAVTDDAAQAGLAIISEAKYGFAARSGTLSLSLLRAPTRPDPDCDRGLHRMHFQLRPWQRCSSMDYPVPALAAETAYATLLPCSRRLVEPFAWIDPASIVPSWVAPSLTQPGAWILRLHEVSGMASEAVLKIKNGRGARLKPVNLLEEPIKELPVIAPDPDGLLQIPYSAYAVVTYLLEEIR
ncbi:MAG: alpha-mannosidase [Opitutales bacterium]